jgi:hypothetical protein
VRKVESVADNNEREVVHEFGFLEEILEFLRVVGVCDRYAPLRGSDGSWWRLGGT